MSGGTKYCPVKGCQAKAAKDGVVRLATHLKNCHPGFFSETTEKFVDRDVEAFIQSHPEMVSPDYGPAEGGDPEADSDSELPTSYFDYVSGVNHDYRRDKLLDWAFEWLEDHGIRSVPEAFRRLFDPLPQDFFNHVSEPGCCSINYTGEKKLSNALSPVDLDRDISFDDIFKDEYQLPNGMSYEDTVIWFHFFLTSTVIQVGRVKAYYVKRREMNEDGTSQLTWSFDKNVLKHLEKRQITVVCPKNQKTKIYPYSHYLQMCPEVSRSLAMKERVQFCNLTKDPNILGLWGGHKFPIVEEADIDMELIQPFLDHVLYVICDGNVEYFECEMSKNAWMFQHPDKHLLWATVLFGEQGTGKNAYTDVLCRLWGKRWSVPNVDKVGTITKESARSILDHRKLIVCNELAAGNKGTSDENWSIMKSRITEAMQTVRQLYEDTTQVQNYTCYILISNHMTSIAIETSDRRYFCLEVSTRGKDTPGYFTKFYEAVGREGFDSHLLSWFIHKDTSEWEEKWYQQPPDTPVHQLMARSTESWVVQFIKEERGWWDERERGRDGLYFVRSKMLIKTCREWLDEQWVTTDKIMGKYATFLANIRGWLDVKECKDALGHRCYPKKRLVDYWAAADEEAREAEAERREVEKEEKRRKREDSELRIGTPKEETEK
jgi:hypothetical protein